jgi:hypothetical protein
MDEGGLASDGAAGAPEGHEACPGEGTDADQLLPLSGGKRSELRDDRVDPLFDQSLDQVLPCRTRRKIVDQDMDFVGVIRPDQGFESVLGVKRRLSGADERVRSRSRKRRAVDEIDDDRLLRWCFGHEKLAPPILRSR